MQIVIFKENKMSNLCSHKSPCQKLNKDGQGEFFQLYKIRNGGKRVKAKLQIMYLNSTGLAFGTFSSTMLSQLP